MTPPKPCGCKSVLIAVHEIGHVREWSSIAYKNRVFYEVVVVRIVECGTCGATWEAT